MPRLPSPTRRTALLIAGAIFATCLSGCGSALQGAWNGTCDVGPVDAFPMVVTLPAEGFAGTLEIVTGGKVTQHPICAGTLDGEHFELTYEAALAHCEDANASAPSVRRALVGSVGVDAMWGELFSVVDGKREKIGFFRAFRRAPTQG